MDNAKLYKPQKMKYFLVIDQGTSSTRAILFDEKFAVVNVSQTESISITYIRKLYNSLYTILLPRHSIVMKMIQRKGQCMQQAGNIQDWRDQSFLQ